MKTTLKRSISALLITTVLATGFVPRTSNAAVGGILSIFGGAGIPVLVVGGVTTVGAITMTAIGVAEMNHDHEGRMDGLGAIVFGITGVLLGLVILDSSDQQGVGFAAIDSKTAANYGVGAIEMQAYNSELDEVNAVRDEVTARLLESKNPTMELSQATWSEFKGSISPEAFSVVEKISLHMVNAIQAAAVSK